MPHNYKQPEDVTEANRVQKFQDLRAFSQEIFGYNAWKAFEEPRRSKRCQEVIGVMSMAMLIQFVEVESGAIRRAQEFDICRPRERSMGYCARIKDPCFTASRPSCRPRLERLPISN